MIDRAISQDEIEKINYTTEMSMDGASTDVTPEGGPRIKPPDFFLYPIINAVDYNALWKSVDYNALWKSVMAGGSSGQNLKIKKRGKITLILT